MTTIEDTIEILAGLRPRKINIRIDLADAKIISSLGRQISKNVALTDRQLGLILKKIEKYRSNLEKCDIDVDKVLTLQTLRLPLRVIDRTQTITIQHDSDTNKPVIVVKYVFSKKFAEIWSNIEETLNAYRNADKNFKRVPYTEKNLYQIVKGLQELNFTVDRTVQEIYEKIEKILEHPENSAPYLDYVDERILLKNCNNRCQEYLDKKFEKISNLNLLEYVDTAKHLGIAIKSQNLLKKISEIAPTTLTKKISLERNSRYRVGPENYSVEDLIFSINSLNQWPLVIIVEENNEVLSTVTRFVDEIIKYIPKEQINVFFRLKNEQPENQQFNQFIKDNGLNNYIDSDTKVVFISRLRIPKPLLKSNWSPSTAVITSSHDFGKMTAYLNDLYTVYYYNNSLTMRNSRLKGADKIVQL